MALYLAIQSATDLRHPDISICVLCTDYWLTRESIWISKTIDQGFISAANRNNFGLQSASSFAGAKGSQVCLYVQVLLRTIHFWGRMCFEIGLTGNCSLWCQNRKFWHTNCRTALKLTDFSQMRIRNINGLDLISIQKVPILWNLQCLEA